MKAFVEKTHVWHETNIAEIDPEEAERTSEEIYRTLIKSAKEFDKMGEKRQVAKRIAESLQVEVKEFINESVPLMLLICNPGMQERHWNEIEALTGVRIPKGETYTINMMLELGLQHHVKAIEDICVSASKEYGLQLAMDKMEKEWATMVFDTKEYRQTGTRILSGIDEIQQLLDDQIVKTQAMKGSRFIKPFLEGITTWEETLVSMQDILDNWLKVQSTWLYLVSLRGFGKAFAAPPILYECFILFEHSCITFFEIIIVNIFILTPPPPPALLGTNFQLGRYHASDAG